MYVTRETTAAPAATDRLGAAYDLRQPRLPKARWTVTDWRPGAASS